MPQQLLYTSAPRGLVTGRSGHCTVACSEGMREALQSRLEQISYYEHSVANGARHPTVCAYRIVSIRGDRYHVLSRIVDAGLDFTKRTNFTAHHLVFTSGEAASLPSPPVIFLHWDGWRDNWPGDPQWLSGEHWGNLLSLPNLGLIPCRNWHALTGDAANAVALLESRPESFLADGLDHTQTLTLIAEGLALQAAYPIPGSVWQHHFTNFLQQGDDLEDFRWRLVYSDSPAYEKLLTGGTVVRPLLNLRAEGVDKLTATYARSGPQPLKITAQPEDATLTQGQTLVLGISVSAVPPPARYQWYQKRVQSDWSELLGQASDTLQIVAYNDPGQISRFKVVVWDAQGTATESREAKVQAERDPRRVASQAPFRASPDSDRVDNPVPTRPNHLRPDNWGVDESIRQVGRPPQKRRGKWVAIGAVLVLVLAVLGGLLAPKIYDLLVEAGVISDPTGAKSSVSNSADSNKSIAMESTKPPLQSSATVTNLNPNEKSEEKLPTVYLLYNNLDPKPIEQLEQEREDLKSKIINNNEEFNKLNQERKDLKSKISNDKKKLATKLQLTEDSIKILKKQIENQLEQEKLLNNKITTSKNREKNRDFLKEKNLTRLKAEMDSVSLSSSDSTYLFNAVLYEQVKPVNTNGLVPDKKLSIFGMEFDIIRPVPGILNVDNFDFKDGSKVMSPFILSILSTTPRMQGTNKLQELVFWPYMPNEGKTIQFTADQKGGIQIKPSEPSKELLETLTHLNTNSFTVTLEISYLDKNCSTNFPFTSTTFTFAALVEMMKTNATKLPELETWESTINNLIKLQEQLKLTKNKVYSIYITSRNNNIWADLDQMCQIVIDGRTDDSSKGFEFDLNPKTAAELALLKLEDAAKSPEDPIATSLIEVLNSKPINLLIELVEFIQKREKGQNSAPSLTIQKIKDNLKEELARCRLDVTRLKGSIRYKQENEPKDVELVHLQFSTENTNSNVP